MIRIISSHEWIEIVQRDPWYYENFQKSPVLRMNIEKAYEMQLYVKGCYGLTLSSGEAVNILNQYRDSNPVYIMLLGEGVEMNIKPDEAFKWYLNNYDC